MTEPATDLQVNLYDRFSDGEFARRHAAVRAILAEQGLDGLIAFATSAMPANVRYLSNCSPYGNGTAYLLFPASGEPLALVSIFSHVISARAYSVVPAEWAGADPAATGGTIATRIHDLNLARGRWGLVEIDSARNRGLPSAFLDELRARLPEAVFVPITAAIENLRRIKSAEEIAALEKSAEMTEAALDAMIAAVRPGATEHDLVGALAGTAVKLGGTLEVALLKSTPMAAPSMSSPWTRPSNRLLQSGDVILSEIGVGYLGYSTQLLRPIAIGRPTPTYRRLFDVAAEVYESVQAVLRPGATEKDIQAAAAALRQPGIAAEAPIVHGWSQWSEYGYHIAVPGEEAHWSTRPVRFEANMSVTIEPNPCTPDFSAGIFLGDLNIISPDGARSLQRRPREFIVV